MKSNQPTSDSFLGFTATKDFRSARRAMRPVEGDTFVTRKNGDLIFCQIDFIDPEWIGFGRFLADSGEPLGFFRMAKTDYKKATIKALRIGSEFRPANAQSDAAQSVEHP